MYRPQTTFFLEIVRPFDPCLQVAWILRDVRYGEVDRGDYQVLEDGQLVKIGFPRGKYEVYDTRFVTDKLRRLIKNHQPRVVVYANPIKETITKFFGEDQVPEIFRRLEVMTAWPKLRRYGSDITLEQLYEIIFNQRLKDPRDALRRVEALAQCHGKLEQTPLTIFEKLQEQIHHFSATAIHDFKFHGRKDPDSLSDFGGTGAKPATSRRSIWSEIGSLAWYFFLVGLVGWITVEIIQGLSNLFQ